MLGPAVGDHVSIPFEQVLVAEAGSPDVNAAGVDAHAVVEDHRREVADVRLGRQHLVPLRLQTFVSAAKAGEVLDASNLEPDEVGGVVGDPLGVGLREPDGDLGREVETIDRGHGRTIAVVSAERLAQLIVDAQPCVVLSGAGVSTESGIPDFRSATGIWRDYDPMEYATIDAFRRDPVKVWDFYSKRLGVLQEAKPNPAHLALAELERLGLVLAVITQNVDQLHRLGGSREVIEVHGSLASASCLACGRREEFEQVLRLLPVPACRSCGAVLKPGVVMFGELLPAGALERASSLVQRAGLLLVIGSSLEVYPVAGLPQDALAAGAKLAIVNRGSTPYDHRADLVIDAPAGETLAAVLAHVGVLRPELALRVSLVAAPSSSTPRRA